MSGLRPGRESPPQVVSVLLTVRETCHDARQPAGRNPSVRIRTVLVMSIDHAMTVARLAADYGVSLTEIGDAMRRLDGPMRNRTVAEHFEGANNKRELNSNTFVSQRIRISSTVVFRIWATNVTWDRRQISPMGLRPGGQINSGHRVGSADWLGCAATLRRPHRSDHRSGRRCHVVRRVDRRSCRVIWWASTNRCCVSRLVCRDSDGVGRHSGPRS